MLWSRYASASAFTKNNPGIKELSIEKVDAPKYLGLHSVTQNLKGLRKLTVKDSEMSMKCDEKFFQMIRKNFKELKSLNLNAYNLRLESGHRISC